MLKEARLDILGSTFEAEYRVYKNDPFVEIVLSSTGKDYKSE